jgi:hypothetical protein
MKKFAKASLTLLSGVALSCAATTPMAEAQRTSAPTPFHSISTVASTVPGNGDVNPYGLVQVTASVGGLTKGNLLVSNFNNSANLQGTGTTVVQIAPDGTFSLFAQIDASTLPGPCPGGIGLTTALGVLTSGWVIVGSLPTTDGTSATAQAGCLLVLNSNGRIAETIASPAINGPWDMTLIDQSSNEQAVLFVTNVLNGTVAANGNVVHGGTVVRINLSVSPTSPPSVQSVTTIGVGFPERTDPAALVIGPTGLGINQAQTTLYVADSLSNRVASISNPMTRQTPENLGTTVAMGHYLSDPLGLSMAANANIITVNGNDGRMVTTTPDGAQVAATLLETAGSPPGAGALFGVKAVSNGQVYFVDDATNTLNLFQ